MLHEKLMLTVSAESVLAWEMSLYCLKTKLQNRLGNTKRVVYFIQNDQTTRLVR